MNADADGMAVRLAIGETRIIQENKSYFAEHGVDLDALESAQSSTTKSKRSGTTILVKNLPHITQLEDITKLSKSQGLQDTD